MRSKKLIFSAIFSAWICFGAAALSYAKTEKKKDTHKEDEIKALKTELMVSATEQKAIDQVKMLIRKYKGTALEPDLTLRLAELYVRRAKTDRFLHVHRKSDVIVELVPTLVKNAEPKRHLQNAIQLYDRIESAWPHFNRMDEVLFNSGFAHQQLGKAERAESRFLKLIRTYSESPLIPEAYLSVGEMKFQQRKFSDALKYFVAIEKYPDSTVYPYGLYKAAWSHYNLRDAERGIKSLEAVIKYGRFVKDQGIDSRLDLRKEALTDLALFYEDVYEAKNAFRYFEDQARELDVAPVILKLSQLYMRHSRHEDNRVVLQEFLKRRPKSDYVVKAYTELMDSTEKLKKYTEVVGLLEKMSLVCEADSSWSKSQPEVAALDRESPLLMISEDPAKATSASAICQAAFQRTALTYASRWLKIWQKDTKNIVYADATEKAFEVYLKSAPQSDEAAKARFVYSELLFKRQKFRAASENYALAAAVAKDAQVLHDANYFALIALEKAVNDKWSDKDEDQFHKLAKKYLKDSPKGKFKLEVQFKTAFIAFEKGRLDEAAPLFKELGSEFANTEKGLKSQDLYLDILNKKKDYRVLKDYASELRSKTKTKQRVAKLTKIYEQSYFLLIQSLEENGNYNDAIKEYQTFARSNTDSGLAKEALWNAMQISFKMNALVGGADSALEFASKYGADKRAIDALLKAAQTYESLGQLVPASEVLLKLAEVDSQKKQKWHEMAADFLSLSGKTVQAKKFYERLFETGSPDVSLRALEKLELMAENSKGSVEHEKLLKKMLSMRQEPYTSKAEIYFLEKEFASAKDHSEVFRKSLGLVGRKGALANTKARARLIQARILADEYRRQSIKSRLDRIALVLQIKTEKLSKAQQAYQSAARYGDPRIAVVAQAELGDLYADYAKSMRDIPVPSGVAENEVEIFRSEMVKLAIPMEEKAFESRQLAYQQAKSIGLQDKVMAELERHLGRSGVTDENQSLVNFDSPDLILPYPNGVGS